MPDAIKKANEMARRKLIHIPLREAEQFIMMLKLKMDLEELYYELQLKVLELLPEALLELYAKY